jgi:Icc-related predicted phosphoesterase
MKICAFSDTHTKHRQMKPLPEADVLVFAGDLMGSGYRHSEVKDFGAWFSEQPHKHKLLVAGNHDRLFESDKNWCIRQFAPDVVYLEDSEVVIDGWKFYGSPWTPNFFDWAFMKGRGQEIKTYWDKIPLNTDVLITHGPPYGFLDRAMRLTEHGSMIPGNVGCEELLKRVKEIKSGGGNGVLQHFFGHIHGSNGISIYPDPFEDEPPYKLKKDAPNPRIVFNNVSICDEEYKPVNHPFLVEINRHE